MPPLQASCTHSALNPLHVSRTDLLLRSAGAERGQAPDGDPLAALFNPDGSMLEFFEQASEIAGGDLMNRLRDLSLEIYNFGRDYALEHGMILADTKFEFGFALDDDGNPTDELILIDEVLTPDSSRYWPAEDFEEGREQDNFNKQIFRNWLQEICDRGGWDKTAPGPEVPQDIVQKTIEKYIEASTRLGG